MLLDQGVTMMTVKVDRPQAILKLKSRRFVDNLDVRKDSTQGHFLINLELLER